MAEDIDSITWWTDFFGINEFFGPNWIFTSGALCYIKDSWCQQAEDFANYNSEGSLDDLDVPNPTSANQLIHYAQVMKTGKF